MESDFGRLRPTAGGPPADGNRPLQALRAGRRPSPTQKTPSRSAQADRWLKAFRGRIHSAHRPAAGRRLSRRLKSASPGAARRASAFADAEDTFPVGAGRPLAEGLQRPNSFGAQAGRRPKALAPI